MHVLYFWEALGTRMLVVVFWGVIGDIVWLLCFSWVGWFAWKYFFHRIIVMCYTFGKHWLQGCWWWWYEVSWVKFWVCHPPLPLPPIPYEGVRFPGASAGGNLRMMAGWGGSSLTRRGGNGDNGGKCYGLVKLAKCSVKRVACKPRQIGATASCKFASAGKKWSFLGDLRGPEKRTSGGMGNG